MIFLLSNYRNIIRIIVQDFKSGYDHDVVVDVEKTSNIKLLKLIQDLRGQVGCQLQLLFVEVQESG